MRTIAAIHRWLTEWRPLWLAVGACALSIVMIALSRQYGPVIIDRMARVAGLALQLVAIATAFLALTSVRRQFEQPSIAATISSWWRRRPWTAQPTASLSSNATMEGIAPSGHMYSWAASDPTTDVQLRVAALEQQVTMLRLLWKEDNKTLTQGLQGLKEKIAAEADEISNKIVVTSLQVKHFAVDGIAVAAAGLLCAFAGTVLGAFAPDLAAVLK